MNARKPFKVLQIIHALGMGGAETWLMEVARLWSKSGVGQMDFLATSGSSGIFDDEARFLGCQIHYIQYGRKQLLHFATAFRRVLKDNPYDAIHDHQVLASGWHLMMAGTHLPPIRVTHIHNAAYQIRNDYGVTFLRRVAAWCNKRLIGRYASHICGTSRQVMNDYSFTSKHFDHIGKAPLYCGFSQERFLGDPFEAKVTVCDEFNWPSNSKIILFTGRIDKHPNFGNSENQKNSGFAVDIGIELLRRNPRVCMLLVGKPSSAVPLLESRIQAAGLNGRIRFAGIRRDIGRLMLASDALLFPSRAEGLGMVAVEAQASGLPVLASDAVPKECVVIPGLVEFLSLSRSVSEWVVALRGLMERPRNVSQANRSVADSAFSIKRSSEALQLLYTGGQLL